MELLKWGWTNLSKTPQDLQPHILYPDPGLMQQSSAPIKVRAERQIQRIALHFSPECNQKAVQQKSKAIPEHQALHNTKWVPRETIHKAGCPQSYKKALEQN